MLYIIILICVMFIFILYFYYKSKSLEKKINNIEKENFEIKERKQSNNIRNNQDKIGEKNIEEAVNSIKINGDNNESTKLHKQIENITTIKKDSTKLNVTENFKYNKEQEIVLSKEQSEIFKKMEHTNENMFITGKAGTGKSYVLKYFKNKTQKKVLYTAPTGIAALNIEGVTLHSAFGYKNLTEDANIILSNNMRELFSKLDTVVIDEISMVRVDVFNQINKILQEANNNKEIFGGKQVILFGDLFQLPPVADREECAYFSDKYGGEFFFNSPPYKEGNFKFYELTEIFRQNNKKFKEILNNIRVGNIIEEDLQSLNEHVVSEVPRRVIEIVPKKNEANAINIYNLNKLDTEKFTYKADIVADNGKLKETDFTCEFNLELKLGAMIMMITNDQEHKRWVNGTLGIVSYLSPTKIKVTINGSEYEISPIPFNKYKCIYNRQEKKLEYIIESSVVQYPLILAYAITIHKSQGMTYQSIACNLDGCFASGQAYVALSRCANYDALYLTSKVKPTSIIANNEVINFYKKKVSPNNEINTTSDFIVKNYGIKLLSEKIIYTDQYAGRFDLVSGIDDFKININCDDENHIYSKNGRILPSVTEILHRGMYDDLPFLNLEASQTRGSIIHEEIENYLKKKTVGKTRECLEFINFFEKNKEIFEQKAIYEIKTYRECERAKREVCFKQLAMYCEGIYYITGEIIQQAYLIWIPENRPLQLIDLTKEFGEAISINKYTNKKINWDKGNHFNINDNDYISIGIPNTLVLNSCLERCDWEMAKKVARGFEPKYKSRNINYAESYLYKEYLINNNIELSEKQDYWLRKRESATGYINDETQMLGVKPTIFLSSYVQIEGLGTKENPYRIDKRFIQEEIEKEKQEPLKRKSLEVRGRSVLKCNNQGDIIEEYPSIRIASEKNKISYTSIGSSCSRKQRFGGGYIWVYKDEYKEKKDEIFNEKYQNRSPNENKAKIIYMMDDNNNLIREFKSINEASRITGINQKSIRKVANNEQKHAGGYVWKFK